MSSSNARAPAPVFVDAVVDDGDGSREHALISGNVVLQASAAIASRRVNRESGNGLSD
jgi:hypothetical protein